jgi:Divergent InlB B-repeat domain
MRHTVRVLGPVVVLALTTSFAAGAPQRASVRIPRSPLRSVPPPMVVRSTADTVTINLSACPPTNADSAVLSGSSGNITFTSCSIGTVALSSIDILNINGGSEDDTLTIDLSSGIPIPPSGLTFAAGGGSNALIVTGTGSETGSYTPSDTTAGSGTITLGGFSAQFSGLQPVTVSGMASFTLTLPNPHNVIAVDSPAVGQNRVSGSSDGVSFEALTFYDVTSFTIDAATHGAMANPGDSVTIDSSGLVATGLKNLTIDTGPNADTVEIDTPVYALPTSGGTFSIAGGLGADAFVGKDSGSTGITYTLAGGSASSSAGGSVSLTGFTSVQVTGGTGDDTFDVTPDATASFTIDGSLPTPPATPGDTLDVATAGTSNPTLAASLPASGYSGSWTFADRQTVSFSAIETTNAPITVQTSPAGLDLTIDSNPYTSPQTFSWVVGSQHTISVASPQSGSPGTQFVFASWSDAGAISHMITVPGANTTYTATFSTQYQLTTAAVPGTCGVSPASGGFYDADQVVNIDAQPCTGFSFIDWSGPVAAPNSPSTTVTMSQPESVTANFVEVIPTLRPLGLAALMLLLAAVALIVLGRPWDGS